MVGIRWDQDKICSARFKSALCVAMDGFIDDGMSVHGGLRLD